MTDTNLNAVAEPERSQQVVYALETLYEHQDFDFVVETIPNVLAWVQGDGLIDSQPFVFTVNVARPSSAEPEVEVKEIALVWSLDALEQRDAGLHASVERRRTGRTVGREQVAQFAAYGLALVAISVLLPGKRVVSMSEFDPPDFLFDVTPEALRGVEVAGRSSGGFSALRTARLKKGPQLAAKGDLVEVYLSLWCVEPRVSEFYQVKP